jgi:hypothetical protein
MGPILVKRVTMFSALAVVLLLATAGWADEVSFSATTQGCFGGGPGCNTSVLSLGFTGLPTGSVSSSGGSADLVLGSFTLTNTAGLFNPQGYLGVFTALVTFNSPVVIDGGQTATFVAPYVGAVTLLAGGGLLVDFDCLLCNNQQHFTFSNGSSSGSFDLSLNDVVLGVGGLFNQSGPWTDSEKLVGHISNATQTVPEPASLAMLGSGLLFGLGSIRKRWIR